jgi:nitrogen regulatory protein PII-like uncharacterized protein
MTIVDRGFYPHEVDALSVTLETDLEMAFNAIKAQVLNIINTTNDPEDALHRVERMLEEELDSETLGVL